jgi:enoyl-CoA hydratase
VFEIQVVGAVEVLTLSAGRVNALDVEVLEAVTAAVHDRERAGGAALVITGAGRVFSAGVDLNRVLDGGPDYAKRLIPALSDLFEAVFSYPGPTVAAINGAAIAGGCVLAGACDRRLIGSEARIGATELRVGVPFPAAALEVVRYACGDRAEEVLLGGRLYQGEEAVARGLAHRVVAEDVVDAAVAEAADLAEISPEAYANTKGQLRAPTVARIKAGEAIDREVAALWGADSTRRRLTESMESLRKRG